MKKILTHTLSIITLFFISSILFAQPFDGYAVFSDDSDDDYFSVTDLLENADFTIEFWVKSCFNDFETSKIIMTQETNWTLDLIKAVEPGVDDSIYPQIESCINGSCGYGGVFYSSIGDEWMHFVYQYDKSEKNIEMYINGYGGLFFSASDNLDFGDNFFIGKYWFFGYDEGLFFKAFSGYIDEVRVSTGKRYDSFYDVPTEPYTPDANTIAIWHFDESDYPITSVTDASGNGHDLTAHGDIYIARNTPINITGDVSVSSSTDNIYTLIGASEGQQILWAADGGPTITEGSTYNEAIINWSVNGTYNVTAENIDAGTGCSFGSTSLSVTVEQGQIVSENLMGGISILPILNNGSFTIYNNTNSKDLNLIVHDIYGKVVYEEKLNNNSSQDIHLPFISTGYYIVNLSGEGKYFTQKIIVE